MSVIQGSWWFVGKRGMVAALLVAISMACGSPAIRLAAQEHAAPAEVKGTPDVLIPEVARKAAPDFTLADARGRTVTLSHERGKVVLLDFWATWCGGCKLELPWYIAFDTQYRDQGLAVIGISMDDGGMKVVKPFLEQKHIAYPVVIGSDALGQQFGLQSMPLTLLIDRQGRIAVAHAGVVNREDFERHIQQLLR